MENSKKSVYSPISVELEAEKNYAWCTCGQSENQPFCDGTHKNTHFSPKVFTVETAGTYHLCVCKKSANTPHCDGSHNPLSMMEEKVTALFGKYLVPLFDEILEKDLKGQISDNFIDFITESTIMFIGSYEDYIVNPKNTILNLLSDKLVDGYLESRDK
jgi:CDGSH iron-sulfur domain-containing protein 3